MWCSVLAGERERIGGIQLLACLMTAKRPTSVSDQRVHAASEKHTHTHSEGWLR